MLETKEADDMSNNRSREWPLRFLVSKAVRRDHLLSAREGALGGKDQGGDSLQRPKTSRAFLGSPSIA